MEAKFWCCFLLALQIVIVANLVSATSRTFPPNDGVGGGQPGQGFKSSETTLGTKVDSKQDVMRSMEGMKGELENSRAYRRTGLKRIGSSPPSCEHKCYGCTPCEAIQVPTTSHLGLHYANYEAEGWKCKCGPSFYSP